MEATEFIGCEEIRAKSRPQRETGMWKLRREKVLNLVEHVVVRPNAARWVS